MVFNARPSHVFRRVKDFAGQAYATAKDLAPGIKKGAETLRRGYKAASESGLIDEYGGRHAAAIHRGARRASDNYDAFESAARRADGVAGAMRSA